MHSLIGTVASFKEKKAQTADILEKGYRAEFFNLFIEYPDLKWVRWTQYAPYFNDGDPCIFSLHSFDYSTTIDLETAKKRAEEIGTSYLEEVDDVRYVSKYMNHGEKVHPGALMLHNFLHSIEDDFLADLFGHDAEVILTPTEIQIEEYEHD